MAETEARTEPVRERPADADTFRRMFWAGVLPRRALGAALAEIGVVRRWRQYTSLLLLAAGAGLLLAGVVFFVASNWQSMDKLAKLVGLQVSIVGCAVAAGWRGLVKVEGRALLFAACVLVGVFLAAFGQIYQTGADAWELFAAWALLIVLWVIASRAPIHWLLLLAVTDAAIALYLEQVHFYRWEGELVAWLILAVTQGVALVGFEIALRRGYFRLPQIWPRWLLVPVVLFTFAAPTTAVVFDDKYAELQAWLVLLGLAASVVGGYAFYRHVARDLFALTCIGFCCAWVVMVGVLRLLDVFNRGDCGVLLLAGLLVVGMLTLLVKWVRRLNVEMRRELELEREAGAGDD